MSQTLRTLLHLAPRQPTGSCPHGEHHTLYAPIPPQPLTGWCPDCQCNVPIEFTLHTMLTESDLAAAHLRARNSVTKP